MSAGYSRKTYLKFIVVTPLLNSTETTNCFSGLCVFNITNHYLQTAIMIKTKVQAIAMLTRGESRVDDWGDRLS